MKVLGIETSCDETGVAVYDTALPGAAGLRAHAVYSQIALHAEYGGVVPELASRDHVRKLLPLVRQTLAEAGLSNIRRPGRRGLHRRPGPGRGAAGGRRPTARSLAWALESAGHWRPSHGRPSAGPADGGRPATPPFVALLVSGGHTQLVAVMPSARYRLLGETLDDAAGEAFDKTAKMMGLPYPGGPQLARWQRAARPAYSGSPGR
jgi:N6-L-threonylcarbamoyladenine synthase